MSRNLAIALALCLPWPTLAQKKPADPRPYAATITEEDLRAHLYTIAGPEMEGRETAMEGQRKAAAYIEEHFRNLGLKPGYNGGFQMPFPVYRDSLAEARLVVNGKAWGLNTDFQPVMQFNATATQYFSEVAFVGHGIVDSSRDDYGALDVRGRAVLILDGAPAGYRPARTGFMSPAGLYAKIRNAQQRGAAAILLVGAGFPRRAAGANGNLFTELFKPVQTPNSYIVSESLAKAIVGDEWEAVREKAREGAPAPRTFRTEAQLHFRKETQFLQSTNVLGVLEGGDLKNEWLVLTAHYDHLGKRGDVIYYGADDDGSGTVGVIEIAEAFVKAKAEGKGPRRSILFMAVSGEEKGLWGSEYYTDHPTVPLDSVTANLNIDMIGRIDTERQSADTANYVYVVGDDKLSTDLKPASEAVNAKHTKLTLDYKFNDPNDTERIYFRSDHYNFARKGVPIIFYYDGMLKADYHKPTDTPDKIHYPLLAKRARLVFHTAWEMVNRGAMMKRDLPLPTME
jgi:hypothetical protein